ncbi:Rhophilin, Rho GTPase binding protein, partial [Rhizophlyctis rosea]
MDTSVHPSFSILYEGPFADRIPFNEGPECALNGELSTFLSIPLKRNDVRLPTRSSNGSQYVPVLGSYLVSSSATPTFLSLLRSKSKKESDDGGSAKDSASEAGSGKGTVFKPSNLNYVDFKRALMPLIQSAVDGKLAAGGGQVHATSPSQPSIPHAPQTTTYQTSHTNAPPPKLSTYPSSDPASARYEELRRSTGIGGMVVGYSDTQPLPYQHYESITATEDEEERSRLQLLKTTETLMPSDAQWYLLNELRIHAGAPELSENGVERLSNYHAQLLHLEPKFPFETDEIDINFAWFESFNSDRKVITNCIQFEKAAVLYNIAVVYSRLATQRSTWSPDGKRRPAVYFQKAAGVLLHIRDCLYPRFKVKLDDTSDMSEVSLTSLAEVMLAQAMECFYEKADEDKASSPVISMIAAQSADYYEAAYRKAGSHEGQAMCSRTRFPKSWPLQIKAKSHLFTAIAHFHTPPHHTAESAVGERIARIEIAKEAVGKAVKFAKEVGGGLEELVKGHATTITTAHTFLDHVNFQRHHHPSMDPRLLTPLKRPTETLVHPTPIYLCIRDPREYRDVFGAFGGLSSVE